MIERDLGTGSNLRAQLHCRLGLRAAFRSKPMGLGCMNNVTHDLVLCGELEGFFHFEQSSCSVDLCTVTCPKLWNVNNQSVVQRRPQLWLWKRLSGLYLLRMMYEQLD